MYHIEQPSVSLLDLLHVLAWKERREKQAHAAADIAQQRGSGEGGA
jgi:hypothetical protein